LLSNIFKNYTKKASINIYGGISWSYETGYEEVVTNGIPTFYAVDYGSQRVVKFDSNWNYLGDYNLPFKYSFTLKYVLGFFYFSADNYFYKTDSSFNYINSTNDADAKFRQFSYDSSNALFYVASYLVKQINVYNTVPAYVKSINFPYDPYGLTIYNNRVFVAFFNSQNVGYFDLSDSTLIYYLTGVCSNAVSIYIEPLTGSVVTSCENTMRLDLVDSGLYIQASSQPYIFAFDIYRRLIINTQSSIDIYY
jgi:hypothetical protein